MKTGIPFIQKIFKKKTEAEAAQEAAEEKRAKEAEELVVAGKHISPQKMAQLLETIIDIMNNPWRMCWRNFWAGVFRGIGLTIGATIVIALLIKILSALIALQIPYLTEWLTEFLGHITQNVKGLGAAVPPPVDLPPTGM